MVLWKDIDELSKTNTHVNAYTKNIYSSTFLICVKIYNILPHCTFMQIFIPPHSTFMEEYIYLFFHIYKSVKCHLWKYENMECGMWKSIYILPHSTFVEEYLKFFHIPHVSEYIYSSTFHIWGKIYRFFHIPQLSKYIYSSTFHNHPSIFILPHSWKNIYILPQFTKE